MVNKNKWSIWFIVLSFEVPIVALLFLLVPYVGEYYRLFHPAVLLLLWLIVVQRFRIPTVDIYWVAVLLIVAGVISSYFIRQSLVTIIVHAVLLSSAFYVSRTVWLLEIQRPALLGIVTGMAVYALSGIFVYIYSATILINKLPFLRDVAWDEFILRTRYIPSMVEYLPWDDWIGNINKAANHFALSLILAGFLFMKEWITWRKYVSLSLPIATMLVIIFSRGAFVALTVASLVLIVIRKYLKKEARRKFVVVVAVLLAPVVISFSTPKFIDYWTDFSTVATRLHLLEDAMNDGSMNDESMNDESMNDGSMNDGSMNDGAVNGGWLSFLLGYGIGGYGLSKFGSTSATTHNLFLNIYFDYGLLGELGMLAMIAMGLRCGNYSSLESVFALAGTTAIVILGFREYSLVYLDALILGALFLGVFVSMQMTNNERAVE